MPIQKTQQAKREEDGYQNAQDLAGMLNEKKKGKKEKRKICQREIREPHGIGHRAYPNQKRGKNPGTRKAISIGDGEEDRKPDDTKDPRDRSSKGGGGRRGARNKGHGGPQQKKKNTQKKMKHRGQNTQDWARRWSQVETNRTP